MADQSYESECNRAELLGVSPPDRQQWEDTNQARNSSQPDEPIDVIQF